MTPSEVRMPKGTILSLDENRVLSLYDKDGYKTGEIAFGESSIRFSGEMDKSAESLFGLLKYIIDPFFKR